MDEFDVIIVGSGIVGAATALALSQKTRLNIAVVDAAAMSSVWDPAITSPRVSAFSLAAINIFKRLTLWESMCKKRVSPYTKMHVWDAQDNADIQFNCVDVQEKTLGYIIEDTVVRSSILQALAAKQAVTFLTSCTVKKLTCLQNKVELDIESCGAIKTVTARLVIGADGANSMVRELCGIDLKAWDYGHTAIVATVKTTLPHQQTARQHFLTSGPLAFLPLLDPYQSSIVWSTAPEHAEQLLKLNDEDFCRELTTAFDNKLGDISHVEKRYHFPLKMRHAKEYVQENIALVGDAAHTIHPLAGQGVNLGLLDAVCLVQVIAEALKKGRHFAGFHTLRRYERWRRGDNSAMLASIDVIKFIFGNEKPMLDTVRTMGMNLVGRSQLLKTFFANYALGHRGDLPEMARKPSPTNGGGNSFDI